jgi:hypothetical protein
MDPATASPKQEEIFGADLIPFQVNGRLRDRVVVPEDAREEYIKPADEGIQTN